MSYDISIAGNEFNYTINLTPFFVEYIPPRVYRPGHELESTLRGLYVLDGLTGLDAKPVLIKALENIMRDAEAIGVEDMARMWNAANGWGDWVSATHLLTRMLWACNQHSTAEISVYN